MAEIGVSAPPAAAAPPARNGATAATAAPSCWSIKQSYPSSADGTYWLWTPTLVAPQQFYCDMTTQGGGWVLIGRGREGWGFGYEGQGNPADVRNTITGPDAFAPKALSTKTVDGLLDGGRMDALTDGIRVRRATNTTGTTWQEVRMRVKTFGRWSWAFSGGIYLSSITFDGAVTNLSSSNYRTNTTANTQVDNQWRRVNTVPNSNKSYRAGFSYGANVTNGSSSSTSYLWEYQNENNATPFSQVFVRPRITEADIVAQGVSFAPDSGLPASTKRPMVSSQPVELPWGVTGIDPGEAIPSLGAHVTAFAEIGDVVYVGGKFLQVQQGPSGPTFAQPYLAAFNRHTGEWISTFRPALDGPVWEMRAAPDGSKLFVGGEFTSVNGQAGTSALAALDPATGAPVANWVGYVSRPSGTYDVRAMDIQGPWLYVGGNFTRVSGGVGTEFRGPITDSRIARLRLTDGRPDGVWKPGVPTAPQDLDVSEQGDRVYVVGKFTQLNGEDLDPTRLAIIDTVTGTKVQGLQPYQPNVPNGTEWQNAILEVGDKVYQGGSQHFLHQYRRSDYGFERSNMTKVGGDYQEIAFHDGIVYAACHCNNWQYQDANTWQDPQGYTRTDPINFIGAYDATTNLEVMPEFQPQRMNATGAGGEGPWELFFDSDECLWAGGDLVRFNAGATFYGGFERYCQRDTEAPSVPTASATVSGNTVTLSWPASTDDSGGPIQYEVLKDDEVFGTIVMGSTFSRNLVDEGVVGPTRYFVRAVDAEGNRSATTPVVSVSPPPPAAATIIASGAQWSYRDDGQDLGAGWRQPGHDVSSWPTGAAELGWGDGDEATVISSAPVTHYFVRHVDVLNPSSFKTFTVSLKRDDGAAVYLNGVEVVRDNLPAGELHADTPASSFISGPQESTWFEYQIPASLFTSGDNTIAVELHQGSANNGDGSFDLELIARFGNESNPPSAPAPTVTATGFNTVDLAWAPSTDDAGVAGYLIKRNEVPVAFTASTSYQDHDLSPETAYSYEVIAYDTSGNASAPGTTGTMTGMNPTLVRSGDVWAYRSVASEPPAGWNQPGHDVSSWPTGPSELGWGDGDEKTVVPVTRTQYYVRNFQVDNPSTFPVVSLRFKRDDGAAVYLNGTELARHNLPATPLLYTTYANPTTNGAAENEWHEVIVPGDLLVTGNNVVAAEVHQNTNANNDSSFDLVLENRLPTEGNPPTRPNVTLTEEAGSSVTFQWTTSTDDSAVLGYVIMRDGVKIGYTAGTTFTDTTIVPNGVYGYQVIAVDTSGNLSTPGSLAVSTQADPTLVPFGASWRYRFDGVNLGTAWRELGYDDAAWGSGPAPLGTAHPDLATQIGPAVAPTPITAYFRRTIDVANPSSIQALTMDVERDDGFVAYINGVEVGRVNMPAGTISYSTRPLTGIPDPVDERTPVTVAVPPSVLVSGENMIAVEMHQANNTSKDLRFNLRLQATFGSAPAVTVSTPADGSTVNTPITTLGGLCTTTAGTVTATLSGTASVVATAPCVANEWSVGQALADGTYSVVASQTVDGVTGTSPAQTFSVDTLAPVVTITAPSEGAMVGSTPMVSGTCSTTDGSVTIEASGPATVQTTTGCIGGAFSASSNPLADGAYSLLARQTDAAGNVGASAPVSIVVDVAAPVTTDDAAATGDAWRSAAATVTLSPSDAGSGVSQTYYTVDGSTPTTSSASGTSIVLDAEGVYTVKYFSVDNFGNAEGVKTAANQIRIDRTVPTVGTTFPAASSYNAASWAAGCPAAGLCGSAADALAGVGSVSVQVRRQSDGLYWNGSTWQAAAVALPATGTTTWNLPLAAASLTSGVSYQATVTATDVAGNPSAPASTVFTYDASGPTVSSTASANKNGAINVGVDTFSVTFNEPLNPASVPATATLTIRKALFSDTTYAISGLTDGNMTTGAGGYFGFSLSTRQVQFGGTLTLSADGLTVTFTVTGSCSGDCSNMTSSPSSGAYQYRPASSLRDLAGNAPSTATFTAPSQVIF